MRRGTARIGEGEILTTLMQNIPSRDAMITSDGVIIVKCSICHKLALNCDYPNPKPPMTEIGDQVLGRGFGRLHDRGLAQHVNREPVYLTYVTCT